MSSDGKAGREKSIGEIGEICYRGRQTFLGFYNMPDETRKVLSKDGWFYSGDIGYQTPDGRLALQGRSKMMIRTKGYNVFPAEVEQTLKANPAIKDAIVIGRPHRIFDEAIIALVQPKAPLKPSELTQDIFDKAVEDLAGYKKPLLFIPVQSLPPNRVTRADFESVIVKADEVIENLRSQGKYDGG
jgi:fatty-acyl-CoA synthase